MYTLSFRCVVGHPIQFCAWFDVGMVKKMSSGSPLLTDTALVSPVLLDL